MSKSAFSIVIGIVMLLCSYAGAGVFHGVPMGLVFAFIAGFGLILAINDEQAKGSKVVAQVFCLLAICINLFLAFVGGNNYKNLQEERARRNSITNSVDTETTNSFEPLTNNEPYDENDIPLTATDNIEQLLSNNLSAISLIENYNYSNYSYDGVLNKVTLNDDTDTTLFYRYQTDSDEEISCDFIRVYYSKAKEIILEHNPAFVYDSNYEIIPLALTIYDGSTCQCYLIQIDNDGISELNNLFVDMESTARGMNEQHPDEGIVKQGISSSNQSVGSIEQVNEIDMDNSFTSMIIFCKTPWETAALVGSPNISDNISTTYLKSLQQKTYELKDGGYYLYSEIASELRLTPYLYKDGSYYLYKLSELTTKSRQEFLHDLFKCANAYMCAEAHKEGGNVYSIVGNSDVRDLYTSIYDMDCVNSIISYDIISDTCACYLE